MTDDGKPRAYTDFIVHDGTQRSGGARARAWEETEGALTSLVWLPGKEWVVTGGVTGNVKIWDKTGKAVFSFKF